jgi:hypothetical protein
MTFKGISRQFTAQFTSRFTMSFIHRPEADRHDMAASQNARPARGKYEH